MDEKLLYYIWLSCTFRAGSPVPKLLLNSFHSITDIYNASKDDYELLSLSKHDYSKLSNKDLSQAKRIYKFCNEQNIGILTFDNEYYPERLKLTENPPAMFYYRGRLKNLDDFPCITMVGTRSCSERGFRHAYSTAYDAASKGAVIVNGIALGIDGACLAGALDANGYAVGILGNGIDRIYPADNKEIFERLCATGLILTEFAPFTVPDGKNFPVRNRVLSGISIATCVFEAELKRSGAMITAEHAINQGKRLFAVPGKPYDKNYSGPLDLIKKGATVFTEANDILTEYSMSFPHRINLDNHNAVPLDKLDKLVSLYFKKDSDPDAPVNRRRVPQNTQHSLDNNSDKENDKIKKKSSRDSQRAEKKPVTDVSVKKKAVTPYSRPQTKAVFMQLPEEVKNTATTLSASLSILNPDELKIYNILLEKGSATADEIAACGIKIEHVLSILTLLEIYEQVEALPGGRYKVIKS